MSETPATPLPPKRVPRRVPRRVPLRAARVLAVLAAIIAVFGIWDKLDYVRMAKVVAGVREAVRTWTGPRAQ